jgi:CubicO group peptidase (beta-lactamase class C family)
VITLVVLSTLLLLVAFLIYPRQYVVRVLAWRDSDVRDYQKFPERLLKKSPSPFYFARDLDEERVRTLFESNPQIDNLDAFLAETGTQAFIVIQDDTILYERYFNGAARDSIVTSFSVAKSFGSALIGIAIEEGYISDVRAPITDYLPELAERDTQFAEVTIRDLLLMSSGIKYVETDFIHGDDAKTYYFPDLRRLALEETRILDPPGEYFLYNNFHPLLLGMILERATGRPVTDYLQEKIWTPVGMEFDGSWSLDSEATRFEKMESGINARAIDFAKFGRLYLNGGIWQGTQVIPSAWVAESMQIDPSTDRAAYYVDEFGQHVYGSGTGYYKYMWYGLHRDGGGYDFSARGDKGQFIYVSPRNNLIIVRNGERYGVDAWAWAQAFYQFASSLGSEP